MLTPRRRIARWRWRVFGAIALFALMFGVYTWGVPLIHASVRHLTTGRQLAAEAARGDPRAPHTDITSAEGGVPGSIQTDARASPGKEGREFTLAETPPPSLEDAHPAPGKEGVELTPVEPPIPSSLDGEGEAADTLEEVYMPDVTDDDPQGLTAEFIEDVAQDGYVMVAMANEHYLDFTLSWIANIEKTGIMAHIVGATDEGMYNAMTERGIPTWLVDIEISENDLGWGTEEFMKLSRWKIHVLLQFVELAPSVTVILSDVDTAWLRNPLPFFDRYPEADILTSSDMIRTTVQSEDLEHWPSASTSGLNVGILVVRPTDRTKDFLADWDTLAAVPNSWDQTVFSEMLQRDQSIASCGKGLWKVMGGNMTVGALPVAQFAGHAFWVQHKGDELHLSPFVVHTIFQYGGTPGKRNRLREAMLFDDPPSYYDHPKGFINIRVDIPQPFLDIANGRTVQGELTEAKLKVHFALINYQLLWIRAGIALAQLTGRALIMPRIWAELDRYWPGNALWDGNIPGANTKKPFVCPMDHIMDMERGWYPPKDEEEYGPDVEWREYSFLQNPRLPTEVYNSRLAVEVCQTPGPGCANGSQPAAPSEMNVLRLAPRLDSVQLSTLLGNTSEYKILDVTNIIRMWPPFHEEFGWFNDVQQHQRFVKRIKEATDSSCCINIDPKWVNYDMLWDVPHTDKFGRRFDVWRIMRGDEVLPPSPLLPPPPAIPARPPPSPPPPPPPKAATPPPPPSPLPRKLALSPTKGVSSPPPRPAQDPPEPQDPPAPHDPPAPEDPPAPHDPPEPEDPPAPHDPPKPEDPPAPHDPPAPQTPATPPSPTQEAIHMSSSK